MRPRRGIAVLLGLGVLASATSAPSGATYTATSANRANALAAAADWVAPTVSVTAPGATLRGAAVTIAATAADAGSGVASVRIQRSPAGQGAWSDICTDASAPFSCALDTTAIADGRYDLRAIALDRAGNAATSATVANVLVDNDAPTVTLADPGSFLRGTVTLNATATDAGAGVTSVVLQRSPADAQTWTEICADTSAPYSCTLNTTTLANDAFDLRAIATDGAGNATTSDLVPIEVDNLAPVVSMTDPGATISGTITLATTATDADSGVASVTIQRSPTGLGIWTDVCAIAATPWSCRFNTTTVSDGLYDFRATAVDAAGNTRTSATVTARRVDNTTVSTVSLEDPGAFLRGSVTLNANANALGGVASVRMQRSRAGLNTWTDICTDTTAPYTCAFDTATAATPDGVYDLRAIMTSNLAVATTSAVVASRTIDNTLVRGVDVQTINKTGGTAGRVEAGDRIVLTYSEAMKATSLVSGWTGAVSPTFYVRLSDAAGVESIGLTANAAGSQATGLGALAMNSNYVRKNRTVTFGSTATLSTAAGGGSVVTITLGAASAGVRTYTTAVTMKWTPSATATDLAGNASSTAPVTETGAADGDF